MGRKIFVIAGCFLMAPLFAARAENIIRTSAPIAAGQQSESVNWVAADALVSDWVNSGELVECGSWAPTSNEIFSDVAFTQSSSCKQYQERHIQQRERQLDTQTYRNIGDAAVETRSFLVERQQNAIGTAVATSCMMIKQGMPSSTSGVYSIEINARSVSVYCDMVTNGGGWTVVGRGYQDDVRDWATTRGVVNPGRIPGELATVTAKLADNDINAIPKTAFKVVTTGYNNIRYFKGSCVYNHLATASGDCAISYADLNWTGARGNGLASSGWSGLSDNRANVVNDGVYIFTSAPDSPAYGWAAGDGTILSSTGNALSGTRISQYIYVR